MLGFTSFNPTYTVVQMMIKANFYSIIEFYDSIYTSKGVGTNYGKR
jgi:hypothetical protein